MLASPPYKPAWNSRVLIGVSPIHPSRNIKLSHPIPKTGRIAVPHADSSWTDPLVPLVAANVPADHLLPSTISVYPPQISLCPPILQTVSVPLPPKHGVVRHWQCVANWGHQYLRWNTEDRGSGADGMVLHPAPDWTDARWSCPHGRCWSGESHVEATEHMLVQMLEDRGCWYWRAWLYASDMQCDFEIVEEDGHYCING